MKIRNPWVIKCIGLLGAWLIRFWVGTLCYRYRHVGTDLNPMRPGFQGRYLYVFWHENMLLPCHQFARRDVRVLISQHADGEMIAQVCRHFGCGAVRGSSTRGGVQALRQLMRASKSCHLVVLPDGPCGPRRHVEPGLVYLAARTGLPIVLVGVGYDRPWRLRTWDRFAIPRPFSKGVVLMSGPLTVPADANRAELEEYRQKVEKALLEVSAWAELLAER